MDRYIGQLKDIQKMCGFVPIIFCGDLFDRWNAPAELINWCIDKLPMMYGIPGNHDLPYHRYADLKRSAFYTLVKAGRIKLIDPGDDRGHLIDHRSKEGIRLWGFPCGYEVKPRPMAHKGISIAVIHDYIWMKDAKYPDAPSEAHLNQWKNKLKGYDFALFGDNHKGFIEIGKELTIVNNGGFMRRKSDEVDYAPRITVLGKGGAYPIYLNTEKDLFTSTAHKTEQEFDAEDLIEDLQKMDDATINFEETLKRYLKDKKIGSSVRQIIHRALGE